MLNLHTMLIKIPVTQHTLVYNNNYGAQMKLQKNIYSNQHTILGEASPVFSTVCLQHWSKAIILSSSLATSSRSKPGNQLWHKNRMFSVMNESTTQQMELSEFPSSENPKCNLGFTPELVDDSMRVAILSDGMNSVLSPRRCRMCEQWGEDWYLSASWLQVVQNWSVLGCTRKAIAVDSLHTKR